MSIESNLTALLKTICPRTFPDFAPFDTVRPYVTYQAIGGQIINPLGNELPNKRNTNVQINIWSNTRLEANSIIEQVEVAMRASTQFIARPQAAPMGGFDADIPVYSAIQDFTIWGDR